MYASCEFRDIKNVLLLNDEFWHTIIMSQETGCMEKESNYVRLRRQSPWRTGNLPQLLHTRTFSVFLFFLRFLEYKNRKPGENSLIWRA